MSGRKRCEKEHAIRAGQTGDKPIEMTCRVGAHSEIPVAYVLLCDGIQVGGMEGSLGMIINFEIFKEYRGVKHSEIFLELIIELAKQKGIKQILTTPARPPFMKKALVRCGFTEFGDEEYTINLN